MGDYDKELKAMRAVMAAVEGLDDERPRTVQATARASTTVGADGDGR